jgi:hypothetical protein
MNKPTAALTTAALNTLMARAIIIHSSLRGFALTRISRITAKAAKLAA